MALHYTPNTSTISDLTLHLDLPSLPKEEQTELRGTFLPAEWYPQSGVQLTWPHANTDWAELLPEVDDCFVRIALEVLAHEEKLLIVTPEPARIQRLLHERIPSRLLPQVRYFECPTNDTWARDHAFLTLITEEGPRLLDFQFNGWGNKFPAELDNQICRRMVDGANEADGADGANGANGTNGTNGADEVIGAEGSSLLRGVYEPHLDFVLEGGSIESDGRGTLMTTSECLLSAQRNPSLNQQEIERCLLHFFHAQRVLWVDHGYLAGDDTDSHIDTLARFCPNDTIVYVQCTDPADEHYEELRAMEEQLKTFSVMGDAVGEGYHLIPLPLPAPIYDPEDGHRLPATYANFLILNRAVLLPTYGQPELDELARRQLQKAFPRYDVVPVDCRVLIRQHGSLHCSTMQYPAGVL